MPKEKATTQPQPIHLQPQPIGPGQQAGTINVVKPPTKPKQPAKPPIPIDPERLAQLHRLAFVCHPIVKDAIYEDPTFTWADAEAGGVSIYGALPSYQGEVSSEAFETWAIEVALKGARQHQIWRTLMADHTAVIKTAIRCSVENNPNNAVDYSVGLDDLFSQVSYRIFEEAQDLAKPGTAKLSTRLVALAKKHLWLYFHSKNMGRHRSIRKRLEKGKDIFIEIESEEQQTANRALDKIAKSRLKAA
jgi:hypothetical protein